MNLNRSWHVNWFHIENFNVYMVVRMTLKNFFFFQSILSGYVKPKWLVEYLILFLLVAGFFFFLFYLFDLTLFMMIKMCSIRKCITFIASLQHKKNKSFRLYRYHEVLRLSIKIKLHTVNLSLCSYMYESPKDIWFRMKNSFFGLTFNGIGESKISNETNSFTIQFR